MRDWSVGLVLIGCLISPACTPTPGITVVRISSGDKAEAVRGDVVKLKRGAQEYPGAQPGFFVVRGVEDWQRLWADQKAPPIPSTLDTNAQMLVVAIAESPHVTRVKLQRAVETAEMVHVWVRETTIGEGCIVKPRDRAFDAAVSARVDKPIKFHVEQEPDESCGPPPSAKVQCRSRTDQTWGESVSAEPGDIVECELTATARGKFELVDRVLSMAELPAGSSAKISFAKGPHRGELGLDVYGTYVVTGEAVDEAGRRGKASATIDVKPPKTKDVLVQLVWTNFDLRDESDTFPRVNLRVSEQGPRGQRCSAEVPVPGLCEVKTRGAYTYMRIPEGKRLLPVSVQFLDERIEKGPGPCVHVWFDGARTSETCDREHRDPDAIWRVGLLDTTTGKLTPEDRARPR